MKIDVSPFCSEKNDPTDLAVYPFFLNEVVGTKSIIELDGHLNGLLIPLVGKEKFLGAKDTVFSIHTHGKIAAERLLFVGLGERSCFSAQRCREYASRAAQYALGVSAKSVHLVAPSLELSDSALIGKFLTEGFLLSTYRFEKWRSEEAEDVHSIDCCLILAHGSDIDEMMRGVAEGEIFSRAIARARDLVNEPANYMTPTRLSSIAAAISDNDFFECQILGPKEIEALKMGLLSAVTQGSNEEPRFIHIHYKGKGAQKSHAPISLVGKGVTFDSGGLSLKPTSGMLDMKCDMAGAAAVLAVMEALPSLGIEVAVDGIIAATENMISGSAFRLGDVIHSMSGRSVEVVNTDAEGRLILADAITYALSLEPSEVIDIATLTGACMVALGMRTAGVMGNSQEMVDRYLLASDRAGEDTWQLPLTDGLQEQLESAVADCKNSGDRWGGAITAALFLKSFVGDLPWTHIDIAGPSYAEKTWSYLKKGGTGYGVSTLLEYLLARDRKNLETGNN